MNSGQHSAGLTTGSVCPDRWQMSCFMALPSKFSTLSVMPARSRAANADGLNLQRLGGILNGLEGSPHGKSWIKVMRQMKKSKSDHTLALAKAGLSAIPVVGGSIASLVGDYIPTATQKSIDRALELLRNRLEELGDRIDVEAINKDDFAELFKSCYLSIVRSHRDNKLKAATAILANLFLREDDPDKLTYTELDHYARCVETLSSGAVEVLGMVVQMAHSGARITSEGEIDHEGRLDWRIESSRMNFSDLHRQSPQPSPHLLMGLIAELDRANLLYRGGAPAIETADYGNHPIRLTPLGTRFCKFLLEQDGTSCV